MCYCNNNLIKFYNRRNPCIIAHDLSIGVFLTPYGNLNKIGTAQRADADGAYHFYGSVSNPKAVVLNSGADRSIIPMEDFKNVVDYIRNTNAVKAYK